MKSKLLYIVGLGHNGSTLLDLLLGASPDAFSTSQLNDLLAPWSPKGDGKKDVFWRSVLASLGDEGENLSKENQSVILEKRILSMLFSKRSRGLYWEVNRELLNVLMNKVGKKVIVDSSKNVCRALGLIEGGQEIYMLHLVRDLRSYVNSYNMRQDEMNEKKKYLYPTLQWYLKNILSSTFVKWRAAHYKYVKYEDFISDPTSTIREIGRFCDVDLSETINVIENGMAINPSERMTFRGNRILNKTDVVFNPKASRRDGVFQSNLFWWTLGWPSMLWGYKK